MVTLILSLVMIINILLSAVFLFFERRDIGYTWAWLMIFYFIPILGFIVYLFLGRNLKRKISTDFQLKRETPKVNCREPVSDIEGAT